MASRVVAAGSSVAIELPGQREAGSVPPRKTSSPTSAARLGPVTPRAEAKDPRTPKRAWRAPLLATFVPGLGHAWAGKPGWGVGLFAATLGATLGAVSLGLATDASDGATPSDASRAPGYARLGAWPR